MTARQLKYLLIVLAVALTCLPGFFCKSTSKNQHSEWLSVYDTSVHYVGMQTCRSCHESVYQTFHLTGMGQSFDSATRYKSAADFNPKHAIVYDTLLDFYYQPFWKDSLLFVKEFRIQNGDTVHQLIQEINFIIGSGQHTNSHLFQNNGYLFQAPITFYTQKGKWDMAPGFENGASSRFSRVIETECVTCHNAYPEFIEGSRNKYAQILHGIDCERCHGPGSLHVQEKSRGHIVDTSKSPDYTIVNPRRLSVELQNDVCQRCHLQGISVLNEGKTMFDFRPGMRLSETQTVFMPEYKGAQDKMIMASHVERMKKSQCFIVSQKMSCITCHNPHVSVKQTALSSFNQSCNNCHNKASAGLCTETLQNRARQEDNCVGCHMPKNGSIDIPHVAVTDHFIRKNPANDESKGKIEAFLGLRSFNNPNPDAITIGRGYLEFYERFNATEFLLDSALFYISKNLKEEEKKYKNKNLIRAYFLKKDYPKVTGLVENISAGTYSDAWSAYRVGEAFSHQNQLDAAEKWYKRACEILPLAPDFQNKYATILIKKKEWQHAEKILAALVQEHPYHVSAKTNLGFVLMQKGKLAEAEHLLKSALHLDPDNGQTVFNLAIVLHSLQKDLEAKKILTHFSLRFPDNLRAKTMLADL